MPTGMQFYQHDMPWYWTLNHSPCCRHRLVVPKYNPARTTTPEGAVGLGGAYMCIYPMDSPGGYQLIGRTLPIWNTFGRVGPFTPAKPWLLRNFDQVLSGYNALRQASRFHFSASEGLRCVLSTPGSVHDVLQYSIPLQIDLQQHLPYRCAFAPLQTDHNCCSRLSAGEV